MSKYLYAGPEAGWRSIFDTARPRNARADPWCERGSLCVCIGRHQLNGYLVLQGNIRFRTARFKHFRKLLARKRLGTRWVKYPFSRCRIDYSAASPEAALRPRSRQRQTDACSKRAGELLALLGLCVSCYVHAYFYLFQVLCCLTTVAKLFTLLGLRASSLRRGRASLICIAPIWTDDPRRGMLEACWRTCFKGK